MKAVVAAGLLLTGCFYIDPIETRPDVQICLEEPSVISRGGIVTLEAKFGKNCDMEAALGTYNWKMYACTGYDPFGSRAIGCDDELDDNAAFCILGLSLDNTAEFSVPLVTLTSQAPTQGIRVKVAARDGRGAVARGGDKDLPVADAPPAGPAAQVCQRAAVVARAGASTAGSSDDAAGSGAP